MKEIMKVNTEMVNVTKDLASVLMGEDAEHKVRALRRICSRRELEPEQRLNLAYEYLMFVMGKTEPVAEEGKPSAVEMLNGNVTEIEPVRKYNRITFNKKMEIIDLYLNNDITQKKIAEITGINRSSVNAIIAKYREKYPDVVAQAKNLTMPAENVQ